MRCGHDRHALYRCGACGTVFEEGIADRARSGEQRCPQCGLSEAELIETEPDGIVIRHTTKFR